MTIEIRHEPISALAEHARLSIAFEVRTVLDVDVRDRGLGGFVLTERSVTPWTKDYDALDENSLSSIGTQFDLTNWGLLSAWSENQRVGGALIAYDTAGVNMLGGRRDLALIWDFRVAPSARGTGVGRRLFEDVERWARARACTRLDVETQNINVPACRFYTRMGCELHRIHRFAYPDLPAEVQMVWSKRLTSGDGA